jgi:hypothetical protein
MSWTGALIRARHLEQRKRMAEVFIAASFPMSGVFYRNKLNPLYLAGSPYLT